MKKIINSVLLILLLGFLCQCTHEQQDCLTYQGKIHSYSCDGLVVKVTNRSVNSNLVSGAGKVENVIAVRIPVGSPFYEYFGDPIEESKLGQSFFFEFRELLPEEKNICTTMTAEPSRSVFLTEFSPTCGN